MRKAEVVERAVARTIGDFVSSPTLSALVGEEAEALLRERAKSRAEELHKLEQEKEKLGQRLTTLAETFTDGLMSPESFSRVTREWTDKEAQLSVRIAELSRDGEQTAADRRMLARVEEALRSFPTTWEDLPPQRIRELLLQLVETLTLARDDASAGQLLLTTKLRFMPEMVTRIPTGTLRPDGRGTRREPTLRQLAAIALKTQGLSDADCARRLGVQLPAIRGYLHNARRRTGAATNEELFDSCADLLQEYAALLPLDGRVKMPHPESPEPLSPRQRQVWELRAKGLTYRQIAEQLGTTVGSVSAHMHEARRRLGITREQVPE
jgi:DNA-binding CsgD family transcriptional regulator